MCLGVIANEMPARNRFFHQFRTLADVSPNQKKCRFGVIAIEEVEQLWRDRWIRPIVESKRQLSRRVRPADCRAKELRARMDSCVRGKPRSGRSESSRRFDDPRIHALILARPGTQL